MKIFRNKLIQGTLLLTVAGFITRLIGFAYRIFLADILGAELLGIYQLVFPVYGICFTIYGAGIQTAISQLIASNVENPSQKARKDLAILKWGLLTSLSLSISLSIIIFTFAEPIARYLLLEASCSPYLKILALLFPFCGTAACINGYFYGKKEAKIPAITQIIEQLVRVTSVILLCMLLSATGETGCKFALLGLVLGEAVSCFYNCYQLYLAIHKNLPQKAATKIHPFSKKNFLTPDTIQHNKIASTLIFLAFTLTTTKLIISILHSVEAVFIPAALREFGCSAQDALSIYGLLSGIALPFILFPSTITNSFAVMLLPAIAQAQAECSDTKISKYVTISSKYSLFIGYLFTCIFLLFGKELGQSVFHSIDAGNYIHVLSWLCPFLYLSTTLTSIINGLGKTQLTFLITVISLLVKIYFLVFLVPKYGIHAYLTGTLLSQMTMTILEIIFLKKYIHWSFWRNFLLPWICLAILGISLKKLYLLFPISHSGMHSIILISGICLIISLGYLTVLEKSKCISRKEIF